MVYSDTRMQKFKDYGFFRMNLKNIENYHLVPTVDDKKHYVWAFHQKINNDGLWSILIQGCRNLKIMDFFE